MRRYSFWRVLFCVFIFITIFNTIFGQIRISFGGLIALYFIWRYVIRRSHSRYRDYKDDYYNKDFNSYNEEFNNVGYKKDIIFSQSHIVANGSEEKFNMIFSDGDIDLTKLMIPLENRQVKINIIFSNSTVVIDENIPAVIRCKSIFSSSRLPNNSNISFGENIYTTKSFKEGASHFYIVIDSIFSSMEVVGVNKY